MKELVNEYQDVIPNANFIVELLQIILKNSLMSFDGEYFQQIFAVNGYQWSTHPRRYLHGKTGIAVTRKM